jgi:hypothetical protein
MKTLLIFILFAGMFLVISGVYEQKLDIVRKDKRVEYRFIPRTLYEEQLANNTTFASKVKPLFDSENIHGYDPVINSS